MFRFSSLGNRIFTTMIIISLTTMMVLSTIFIYMSISSITENLSSILNEMVETKSAEIENLLEDASRMTQMIANDPLIQSTLRKPRPEQISQVYSVELELDNQLSFIQNYTSHVFGFYIIGANGMQFKSNFSSPIYKNWQEFDWYKKIIATSHPLWFEPHNGSFTVNTIGQPLITLGRRIIDKSTGHILGVILTDIEVSVLERFISTGMGDLGVLTLYNQNRNPVCSSDEAMTDVPYPTASEMNNPDEIYIKKNLTDYNWELIGKIHTSTIRANILTMMKPIVLIFLFLVLVDFLATISFVKRVTTPLRELTGVMKEVEKGNFNISIPPHHDDDIHMLYSSFNVMVSEIKTLMKDLKEQHEKLRISEMRTLEAQINPHFLYNTLDSIIWLSRNNQSDEVTKLVYSLTNLLRIGLNKGRTVVSIQEEIEHINHYIVIQKIRFQDEFNFRISIPQEIKANKTLKLILQPVIENAIYHGVMNCENQGQISLTADTTEKEICFRIRDNGEGITQGECKEIRDYLDISNDSGRGFGLRNVNMRIKLYFGQEYGVDFDSEPGQGTTISIRIPRI